VFLLSVITTSPGSTLTVLVPLPLITGMFCPVSWLPVVVPWLLTTISALLLIGTALLLGIATLVILPPFALLGIVWAYPAACWIAFCFSVSAITLAISSCVGGI